MRRKIRTGMMGAVVLGFGTLAFMQPDTPQWLPTETVRIDTIAQNLQVPWDICFLPGGEMLFTERPGRVRLYRHQKLEEKPVLTVPDVEARGKMGVLGMCLHPRFTSTPWVYLAYNYKKDDRLLMRVMRYVFEKDALVRPKTILENLPAAFNHTGCRLVFGPDKKLYITTGDADVPKQAQNLQTYHGKILRLNDDGSIPPDNPFVHTDSARHEIWSYGHRNPQGIAFQPGTGMLYDSEHGPSGGDEINRIVKGGNYGWPVVHHRDQNATMMSPLLEFTPSIGPAQAIFYSGKAFPSMKNDLLVGCMRGEAILQVHVEQSQMVSYQFLLKNQYGRIRAVAEGPDGYLYFSTSQVDPPESRLQVGERGFDMILRLRPADTHASQTVALHSTESLETALFGNTPDRSDAKNNRSPQTLYTRLCASCHGASLTGNGQAPSLIDQTWLYGNSKAAIRKSIGVGMVTKGMPAWEGVLSPQEISQMTDFILSQSKQ